MRESTVSRTDCTMLAGRCDTAECRALIRWLPIAQMICAVMILSPCSVASVFAADGKWPMVARVERQPLSAATDRLQQALKFVGSPLSEETQKKLQEAFTLPDEADATTAVQKVLDPLCLVAVDINPESRVSVVEGAARKELIQQGWRTFLVKVRNEAGVTAKLIPESPNLLPVYQRGSKNGREKPMTDEKLVQPEDVANRFLDALIFDRQPLKANLSGLELEYCIIQVFSRDPGKREVQLGFHVGQGTQDLGFRNSVPILFNVLAAHKVVLGIKEADGTPTTASLLIRDPQGRVYPNPARRLAPDFFFHEQIYRADGETVSLPAGDYAVLVQRGPEYHVRAYPLTVKGDGTSDRFDVTLHRWIHPATAGWFSGDHHVHAAGCAHYDSPTEGVTPADMMRHILGEDLNIGCVLSWGPCWYTQKRYFEGKTSALSQPKYLMRYDVEVSGFPSSHAGHLCLLKLIEDDYPGTTLLEEWPSWTQPVLEWGQKQGGVVGYSHSGWGLALPDVMPDGSRKFPERSSGGAMPAWQGKAADKLPDMAMPRFDGIGANEFITTTAHGVCDFISAVDTPAIWELNIWYHTLNCGMKSRISGETDFPCIYGDKVGLGRIYVKQPADQPLDYDAWVQGLKEGRSYCGDGLSHLMNFTIEAEDGTRVDMSPLKEGTPSERACHLDIKKPGKVVISALGAAMLDEVQTAEGKAIRNRRLDEKPYWHLERCRIGETRTVPVELVVNGKVAATKVIPADGSIQQLVFSVDLPNSSWVALRILPSCHTNPIFVEVSGKPIRASRSSAEWCAKAVDVCWNSKQRLIRKTEIEAAKAAYDKAREIYLKVATESTGE